MRGGWRAEGRGRTESHDRNHVHELRISKTLEIKPSQMFDLRAIEGNVPPSLGGSRLILVRGMGDGSKDSIHDRHIAAIYKCSFIRSV
jgi:hypothetical protein